MQKGADMYLVSVESLKGLLQSTTYVSMDVRPEFRWNKAKLQEFLKTHTESEYGFRHYQVMLSYLDTFDLECNINPYDMSTGIEEPTLVKSRPISSPLRSVLIPLETLYFPYFYAHVLKDDIPFVCKLPTCVWRGADSGNYRKQDPNRASRYDLVSKYWSHPRWNIGLSVHKYLPEQTNFLKENMSIREQLKYMFLISVEGNDFATNLSWILLSNSVPMMPKPYIETWKLEHALVEYVHYVPLQNDFRDLETQMEWCIHNLERCKEIAYQSKLYALQFMDPIREHAIVKKVLETYQACA
jgi:hypothetical protein